MVLWKVNFVQQGSFWSIAILYLPQTSSTIYLILLWLLLLCDFGLHPLWWPAQRCHRLSLLAFLYFSQEENKASHSTLRPQTTGAPARPLFLDSHWPRTFPQVFFVFSDFIRKRGLESTWGLGDMNKRIL